MSWFRIYTLLFCVLFTWVSKAEKGIDEAQQINLLDAKNNKFYRLNIKDNTCFELFANGQQKTNTIQYNNVKIDDFPPELASNYFQISPNRFLITIEGTGQLYLFDTTNFRLSRIDKTYFRGYNFLAIQFIRQDTLISVGGSGFWRNHNIATFFDQKLLEWELYGNISDNGPEGISSQFGGYSSKEDRIYCLGYPKLYSENNDLKYYFYQFDFHRKSWTELGTVNFNRPELKDFNKLASKWIPPYFFSYEFSLGKFIDPVENIVYQYVGKDISFFHLSTEAYIKGDYIYSIQRRYNRNQFDVSIDSMTIDQLKKNSIVIGRFYTPKTWYSEIDWIETGYFLLLFILIGLAFKLYLFIQHNKQKELKSWSQLPEQGELFLTYLCEQANFTCTTEKLNEILQCEGKTIESQRQSRSKFISSINLFFERNHGFQEAIRRQQSEIDKRFVNYVISPEAVAIFTKKV